MNIEAIEDPVIRFVAFIEERENIRIRRSSGKPWPWTQNEILQSYRFTNVHREDDAVSRHYQKTIRYRYGEDPLVFPGTVLYRWFNRISTCDAIFNEPMLNNISVFEEYMMNHPNIRLLEDAVHRVQRPYVTGSFIINGKPGFPKETGVLMYFEEWIQKPWREMWFQWLENPPLLEEMYNLILSDGLGSFMRGQIIADLKYLPFMKNVDDWWTWAAPGPGSMRGLNIVRNLAASNPWRKGEWLVELNRLSDEVTPMLEEIHIGKLHNQDLQNCLCEFSKFTKTARGTGRPRQTFKHRG